MQTQPERETDGDRAATLHLVAILPEPSRMLGVDAPELEVDVTENPIPSAKPCSTIASAAAAMAPAITAPHRMSENCAARGLAGVSMLIAPGPFVSRFSAVPGATGWP